MHEHVSLDWWQAEAVAPPWLLAREPREQLAVAAAFEPGLALVLAPVQPAGITGITGITRTTRSTGGFGEQLRIRADLFVPDGVEESGPIDLRRARLASAAAPTALRAVPLPEKPDAAAHASLAAACAELERNPAASASDLEPQLRGWSLYPRDDAEVQVAFEARPDLPFGAIRATSDGGCDLVLDLVELSERGVHRSGGDDGANAAALVALRASSLFRSVAPHAHTNGKVIALGVRLDGPIDARAIALGLCSLEAAASVCAREVSQLASDRELAAAYLTAHPVCAPSPYDGAREESKDSGGRDAAVAPRLTEEKQQETKHE